MQNQEPMLERPEHPTGKEKIAHTIVWVILGIAALAISLIISWALAPSDVLEVKNAPVPVRTIRPQTQADGVVFLDVDFCKNTNAEGRLRMSFINHTRSREIFTPITQERQTKTCERREIAIAIPHDIEPDEYFVHFRIEYQVNPLKRVVEEFDSLVFTVAKSDE